MDGVPSQIGQAHCCSSARKDEGKKDQWQLELDLLYEAPLDQNESEYDASLSSIPSLIETTTPRSTSTAVLPACSISVDVRQVFSPISKLCDLNKHQEDVRRIEQSNLIFSEQVASSFDTFVEDSPRDQVDKVDANDSLVIEHPHMIDGRLGLCSWNPRSERNCERRAREQKQLN